MSKIEVILGPPATGGGGTWGTIAGNIEDQTDLQKESIVTGKKVIM